MKAKRTIRQNLLSILICCSCLPAVASVAQTEWTEDMCIRYAVEHNLRVRNKQLDARIAQTEVVTAIGEFLPSMNAVTRIGKQYGHSINPQTNSYTTKSFLENTIELNVSLPIFEGFTRINKLQLYRLNKEINILLSQVEANNLAFEVLEAFYRHCFNKEMHKLATEQRELSDYYYEQMLEYVDLGIRSPSDLQEAKTRLQSDIYQETVKSNDCRLSLLTLKKLMNLKDRDTLSIVMPDEQIEITAYPLSVDGLYSTSESTLPEFNLMNLKEKAARRSLSVANGNFSPSIRMEFNLNTGYYHTKKERARGINAPFRKQLNDNMNKYIGVCVSLPLFSGLSHFAAMKKEKIRLQQVRNENEQQRLTLYEEIHDTYLSFLAALQLYQLAKEQLCAATLTWKESEEKWKEGMVSMFELLEKRNLYIRSKAEIVRTKLQYNFRKRMIQFYQKGTFL